VDDSRTYIVLRIGVDTFQQGEAITNQLGLYLGSVHWVDGLVDLLRLLPRSVVEKKVMKKSYEKILRLSQQVQSVECLNVAHLTVITQASPIKGKAHNRSFFTQNCHFVVRHASKSSSEFQYVVDAV
jgi:hypothetical protein